jgi:hypothetical protein
MCPVCITTEALMADGSALEIGAHALNETAAHANERAKRGGGVNRFRAFQGLWAIGGLEALEFLERSSEIAADPVIAC